MQPPTGNVSSIKPEDRAGKALRRNWLQPMLLDVHFWVPLAVLLAGSLILFLVR